MKYLIILEPTTTGFSAYSPDLDGCVAIGGDRDETIALMPRRSRSIWKGWPPKACRSPPRGRRPPSLRSAPDPAPTAIRPPHETERITIMALTLPQLQALIRDPYDAKDRRRGVEGTFMWFMEEVGELAAALRGRQRGRAGRRVRRRAGLAGDAGQHRRRRSGRRRPGQVRRRLSGVRAQPVHLRSGGEAVANNAE